MNTALITAVTITFIGGLLFHVARRRAKKSKH